MNRLRNALIGIAPFAVLMLATQLLSPWIWTAMPWWQVIVGLLAVGLACGAWLQHWVSREAKGAGNDAVG